MAEKCQHSLDSCSLCHNAAGEIWPHMAGTPSRWDVHIAVIYQDRVTFLESRNTWRDVTVFMEGTIPVAFPFGDATYDEAAAIAKAREQAPPIDGLTVIGGCVIGDSRRHWEEKGETE